MEHLENKVESDSGDSGKPNKEPDGPNWFFQPEFVPSVLFEDVAEGASSSAGCAAPSPPAGDGAEAMEGGAPALPLVCDKQIAGGNSDIGETLMTVLLIFLIISCCFFWYCVCKYDKAGCIALLKC
jgi:hypothetical protein